MKKGTLYILSTLALAVFASSLYGKDQKLGSQLPEKVTLSLSSLQDKIKGGWAGQTIGCTFGGPTEFQFKGTMIHDLQKKIKL